MELRDCLVILRRRWSSAAVVAFLVLGASVAVTLVATPSYTATTRLYFGVQGSESVTDLAQGSTFAANQMASFAAVAVSPLVLQDVVDDLGLPMGADQLARSVTTTVPRDTVILEVAVVDGDAARAAAIANAIGGELITVAAALSDQPTDGSDAVRATVLAPARAPADPTSPNALRNLAVGVVLGLALGLGVAVLRQLLDPRIRDRQDVRTITGLPVLGALALDRRLAEHPMIVADDPDGVSAEAIRRLRTNLRLLPDGRGGRALVITSSVRGEGTTTTSLNLAASLAAAGHRVLWVSADLRGSGAGDAAAPGRGGLSAVLTGAATLADVVQPAPATRPAVLSAGPVPLSPSDLVGSTAMAELVTEARRTYDVVLFDAPPLLELTDAAVLTQVVGQVLVVVGADRARKRQLREALSTLEAAGADVLGLDLNRTAATAGRTAAPAVLPVTRPTVAPAAGGPTAPMGGGPDHTSGDCAGSEDLAYHRR